MRVRQAAAVFSSVGVIVAFAAVAPAPFAGAAVTGSPPLPMFTEPLPKPPTIDATGGGTVALDAVRGSHSFSSSLPLTPTFGYVPAGAEVDGAYLGPTIEVRRGVPIRLTVNNKLSDHPLAPYIDTALAGVSELDRTDPRTAVHLHGGHVPAGSDGGPTATYRPAGVEGSSGTASYSYPNDQQATQLWYHDHAMGVTRLNVIAGLAGNYLVRDAYDTGRVGSPLPIGQYEIPLVLQDRSFNADGTMSYPGGGWAPEYFGDVATVNGKAWPYQPVARGIYRFRMVNGSNSRFYRLSLRSPSGALTAARMWQIGAEGGLFAAPVAMDKLVIAPGERADLLVDFRGVGKGSKVVLRNDAATPYPLGATAPGQGGLPLRSIMQFTGTGASAVGQATMTFPPVLRSVPEMPTPSRTRTLLLNEVIDPATGAPTAALINNLSFHDHQGTGARTTEIESPRVNTVEQWDIVNTTVDAHPIHLHLTQFRVLNRQAVDAAGFLSDYNPGLPDPTAAGMGPWPVPSPDDFLLGTPSAPAANEAGWKDTVVALPGQVTRIIVPFGGSAAGISAPFTGDRRWGQQRFLGDYVYHCHILEHEDNDMMQPFRVVR